MSAVRVHLYAPIRINPDNLTDFSLHAARIRIRRPHAVLNLDPLNVGLSIQMGVPSSDSAGLFARAT